MGNVFANMFKPGHLWKFPSVRVHFEEEVEPVEFEVGRGDSHPLFSPSAREEAELAVIRKEVQKMKNERELVMKEWRRANEYLKIPKALHEDF